MVAQKSCLCNASRVKDCKRLIRLWPMARKRIALGVWGQACVVHTTFDENNKKGFLCQIILPIVHP
jgi:hypothetical protein